MYALNYSANQYKANSVNCSPQQLIVMCYDGVIRFLNGVSHCIETKDIEGKVKNLNKALAIVDELQNSLDFTQGGEIAVNLDRVYDYFGYQLMQVGMKNDLKALSQVMDLVKELRSAWAKVAQDANVNKGSASPQGGFVMTG